MCKCTPNIRTPFCGKLGCEWPGKKPSNARKIIFAQDELDAARYRWLRERDIDAIDRGGVFAGRTPENVVLNGVDLDDAIDSAMTHRMPEIPATNKENNQ